MRWDDFLGRMRSAGLNPAEEEFRDDYGPFATRQFAALRNRHFRCMFAVVRVDDIRFETYVFSSPGDAEDFKSAVEGRDHAWRLRGNLVFHLLEGGTGAMEAVLTRTFHT